MGGREMGRCVFSQWGKTSVQTFSNLFLKTLTEGAVVTEAGSLFQYFTTPTENADLAPWIALINRVERKEEKQVRIIIQKTRKYLEGLELLLEFANDCKADRVGSFLL